MSKAYPRVLHAVENIELGKWPLVDALLEEVETTDGGSARNGEIDRVLEFLAANGYPDYSQNYMQVLLSLGRWVEESLTRVKDFRAYPVSLVRKARESAKSNHAEALRILSEKPSFRKIEGRPSERRPKTALDKIGRAVSFAWEVQEHFIEGYVPSSDEERYWLVTLAEKLQRLSRIIEQQARGTAEIDEFDREEFFAELEEFKAAHS